jgi:hypothetical protein
VNVGEGPSRNWDDCRQFGFLAAGGGRKWSKQLEKIKIGDTVIAYLKGYGYVGIGKVTSTSTPATKFLVNGNLIKELPLINDTIRSIKRFSKENGEYLIGVAWQVAVPREQAAWQPNVGLYTTALVCASLSNQPDTVKFAQERLSMTSPIISESNASSLEATPSSVTLSDDEIRDLFAQPEPVREKPTYKNGSEFYSPEDYGWSLDEVIIFPPGKYFLGDPSYAVSDAYKDEVDSIPYNTYLDIDSLGRVAVFDARGDGCYLDEEGHPHYVDSGTLGIVPIDELPHEEWIRLKGLGRILDFDSQNRPPMPYYDEEVGQTFNPVFAAKIDEKGNLYLGWNWFFIGDETPFDCP